MPSNDDHDDGDAAEIPKKLLTPPTDESTKGSNLN
jgi:hypothetical protein